jgi:putative toxin-antitoxin system antitoxin component (TIGR02293 family)
LPDRGFHPARSTKLRLAHQHFNPTVSEQVLHIAEVLAKGTEVFQEKRKLLLWLNTPHKVFSGNKPFTMLGSRFGTELVLFEHC